MKTTKKIFAAVLAVMLIAMMIPFTASAATTDKTLTLTSQVKGFTFDVYQLATYDTSTGALTVTATDTKVAADVKAAGSDNATATLIADCDAANTSALGTKVDSFDSDSATSKAITVATGVYYVKPVAKGFASKASSSIVTVTADTTVDVGTKVDTSGVSVTKEISAVNGTKTTSDKDKAVATASLGDVVEYTLTAEVPNSAANPLKSYVVYDEAEEGLTVDTSSVTVTTADGTALTKDTDYAVVTTGATKSGANIDFGVSLNENKIASFYGKKLNITVNATVNSKATSGANSNDNTDWVEYQFADSSKGTGEGYTTPKVVPGETVQVFTFLLNLEKVDSSNSATKLEGATFELSYTSNGAAKTASATSDKNGKVDFGVQLGEGTYSVKETKAPANYVLNSTPFTVKVTPTIEGSKKGAYSLSALTMTNATVTLDSGLGTVTVTNAKVTVPKTGGMGTTMFFVVGGALIALAGAMLVVLKKKKA